MKRIYFHTDNLSEDQFGSKFSNISKLSKIGIRVPDFFCLDASCFRGSYDPIQEEINNIIDGISWDDHTDVLRSSESIKKLFVDQSLDNELLNEIHTTFDQHLGCDSYVSVRSCVRANIEELREDSADNAFAGMSESIMFLKREDLEKAILSCFSSCYSQQVLTYRHVLGLPHQGMEVVVGIQKMIRGEKSFIMFTKDPLDFKNQTIITCGYGTGEGIVQGKVETDHYLVDNASKIIEDKISTKLLKIDIDQTSHKGLAIYDVPEKLQDAACLNHKEISHLQEVGMKIESTQKYPQDIEGCYDDGGKLYILQSRPIVIDKDNITVWSSLNVSESYPGKSTPLTFSFAQNFYKTIFYDCYLTFGVSRKILQENEHILGNMLGHLNYKIHYNLGHFYRLHGLSPLFPLFRKSWEDMIGLNMGYLVVSNRKKMDVILSLIMGIIRSIYLYINHHKNFKKFYGWWNKLFKSSEDEILKNRNNSLKLYKIFLKIWKEVESNWGVTLVNDVIMGISQTILIKMLKSIDSIKSEEGLLSDLLCGGENPVSVEAMYSTLDIVQYINKKDDAKKLFFDSTSDVVWSTLLNDRHYHDVKSLCDKHLKKYGYRGLQELKLEYLPPKNRPEHLIDILKGQLANVESFGDMLNDDQQRRDDALISLRKSLGFFSIKRPLIIYLSNLLRGLVVQRENSRYCRSELFGISRDIYLAIAENLVKDKILNNRDDIFFCTYSEVEGIILGTGSDDNLVDSIKSRRANYDNCDDEFGKQTFSTIGPVYHKQFPNKEEIAFDDKSLKGLGSSNGIVTGKARIVINPDPSIKLSADEILVAKETDPGWLFLMVSAKGMIVERGSMLSHTAITGRKLGIPTVVSVPNATSIIKDGDMVTLNGSNGVITIDE